MEDVEAHEKSTSRWRDMNKEWEKNQVNNQGHRNNRYLIKNRISIGEHILSYIAWHKHSRRRRMMEVKSEADLVDHVTNDNDDWIKNSKNKETFFSSNWN